VPGLSLDAVTMRGIFSLRKASNDVQTSLGRLATGKKINRASDNPSGMIAGENMSGQIRAIEKRIAAISQQDGYIGAREGGYSVVSDMLTELSGLVVTAANRDAMSPDEKKGLQEAVTGILKAIDFTSVSTTFKSQSIMSEAGTSQLGRTTDPANEAVSLANLAEGGTLNLIDGDLETAQKVIAAAISGTSTVRASFGNQMTANDAEVALLQAELTSLSDAESQIVDTDYAEETSKLMRAQVQQQVATFALQITADQRKGLLDLLKPLKTN